MTERSHTTGRSQDNEDSMSTRSLGSPCQLPLFATVESAPTSKGKTSIGKSTILKSGTRKPKLSKTSARASTSNERDLGPYWTESTREISSRLWLPTGTDLLDSDSSSLNTWFSKTVAKSWFSVKLKTTPLSKRLPKIFSPSSMSFLADYMASENTKTKSKKIKKFNLQEKYDFIVTKALKKLSDPNLEKLLRKALKSAYQQVLAKSKDFDQGGNLEFFLHNSLEKDPQNKLEDAKDKTQEYFETCQDKALSSALKIAQDGSSDKTVEEVLEDSFKSKVIRKNKDGTFRKPDILRFPKDSYFTKCKKIRVYPKPRQCSKFEKYLAAERRAYNLTLEFLESIEGIAPCFEKLAKIVMGKLDTWLDDVPYEIKREAIRDAAAARKAAKLKSSKEGGFIKVSFKSRKDSKKSCYIPSDSITAEGIYPKITGKGLKYTEKLPENLKSSRLVRHFGCWYLCVPYAVERCSPWDSSGEIQARIVALDPGLRTFQTFFSEDSVGKLGDECMGRLYKEGRRLDMLMGQIDKVKNFRKAQIGKSRPRGEAKALRRKTRRLRILAAKTRRKIRNLTDEMHHKLARFLVDNFEIILLPTFETSDMVSRSTRKLNSKTARNMMTLAHYRFKMFLKHKAFEAGKIVIDVNEAYTSKTCSWTGEIVEKLGSKKVIKSLLTGLSMDRDVNGSRGIFLRAVGDILLKLLELNTSDGNVNQCSI